MKKLLIFCLLFMANTQLILAQCAMCRSSVESTFSDGRYINGSGLNTGILYLLSLPYLVVLVVGFLWYRSSKIEREKRLAISRRIKGAL